MGAKKKRKPLKKKQTRKKKPAPKKKKRTVAKAKNGHRVASTILQAITITVIADGEFASEEEELLLRLAKEPFFDQVPDVGAVVRQAVDRCLEMGLEGALARLAKDLPTNASRETAFAACLAAAAADGKITGSEA